MSDGPSAMEMRAERRLNKNCKFQAEIDFGRSNLLWNLLSGTIKDNESFKRFVISIPKNVLEGAKILQKRVLGFIMQKREKIKVPLL